MDSETTEPAPAAPTATDWYYSPTPPPTPEIPPPRFKIGQTVWRYVVYRNAWEKLVILGARIELVPSLGSPSGFDFEGPRDAKRPPEWEYSVWRWEPPNTSTNEDNESVYLDRDWRKESSLSATNPTIPN